MPGEAPAVAVPPPGGSGEDPRLGYRSTQQHKVRILDSHMPEPLERDAVLVASAAVEKHASLKDAAAFVKLEMDKLHPAARAAPGVPPEGVFHAVVGKSFASAVSCATRQFIHLTIDTFHVLVWRDRPSRPVDT